MKAEIISIGDELLIGQVVNTNASWLGEQLHLLGISVQRITAVGDDREQILHAFNNALREHDIVITTGGLGPTHDDITREAVCQFFDTALVFDENVLRDIEHIFEERKRPVTDINRDQAMIPATARIIRNQNGTAPGYHFQNEGKHFFVTPGVPYEMQGMVENDILPRLRANFHSDRASTTILTTGIPESALAEILNGIENLEPGASIAYLPSPQGVRIRLTAEGDTAELVRRTLNSLELFIHDRAAEYVFGHGTETLEEVAGKLLHSRNAVLSVAESCTGGVITDKLTNISGSSQWFERGVIAYSNVSKTALLGVSEKLLDTHGAVSRETAEAMAEGVRTHSNTDIGLSTTGIAGPTGATPDKPVGLVWIGLSTSTETFAYPFYFGSHRIRTKQRAAQAAIDMVRRHLLSLPRFPSILTETP
jgi:nicotinamide-nucleotide amidase